MGDAVVFALAIVCLGAGFGLAAHKAERIADPPTPPPRTWKGTSVTPVSLGPRARVAERVSIPSVMTQGVLLAVEMARADKAVDEEEKAAIRAFIVKNVAAANESFADKVMANAFATKHSESTVDEAIETIRAVGSEEQKDLILKLLIHVAQADGVIHDEELAFMQKIGGRLGLSEDTVQRRISIDGKGKVTVS